MDYKFHQHMYWLSIMGLKETESIVLSPFIWYDTDIK